MKSRKFAAILAFIGGTLLLIAGTTGSTGIVGSILEYLIENIGGATADLLSYLLQILNVIANLGGISVIIGGVLIVKQRKRFGQFMIGIGAGMGLFGFLLILGSAFIYGWVNVMNLLIIFSQSIGWIGIILSIIAIILAK